MEHAVFEANAILKDDKKWRKEKLISLVYFLFSKNRIFQVNSAQHPLLLTSYYMYIWESTCLLQLELSFWKDAVENQIKV